MHAHNYIRRSSTTSSPIKPLLTDVACDNSTLNILRCSPKIKTDGECVTQQIHLQCKLSSYIKYLMMLYYNNVHTYAIHTYRVFL